MTNSNEYMRVYMKARYHERRAQAIAKLGGHCAKCDRTDGLQFDHIEPEKKSFSVMTGWSYADFWKELEKYQLLCQEHHNLKTIEEAGKRSLKACTVPCPRHVIVSVIFVKRQSV